MKLNQVNQIVVTESDVIDALYQDRPVDNLVVEDTGWIEKYNKLTELFDFPDSKINFNLQSKLSSSEFVDECVGIDGWEMPEEYKHMNLHDYLFNKIIETYNVKDFNVETMPEWDRVIEELSEFEKRNMIPVLKFLVYFIDTLRENKIVWGVGRGSSVASYVLYLIGVHRIDSIKYNLDIKEFLK